MDPLKLHFYVSLALLGLCSFVIATGWAPNSARTDNVPMSVRENPASYRPVYNQTTGWVPIPIGGGGYSSGK